MENDLERFDQDFASAPIEDRGSSVPDGHYQANVEKVEIATSKAGNKMLKWGLRIIGPSSAGRMLFRHNIMATPENIKWLKNDLHTAGLDLDKLSDLPANLNKLLDVKLEITKKTKGENENVYIDRRVVIEDAATGGSIPF